MVQRFKSAEVLTLICVTDSRTDRQVGFLSCCFRMEENGDDFKYEDDLTNEDDLINEGDLKTDDNLKNANNQ